MLAHLISFYSDPSPTIVFWNGKEVSEQHLCGEMAIKFSENVFCAGYSDENTHHECQHHAKGKKRCLNCSKKDISNVYASLDFSEYLHLENEYCNQQFSVYLAQFGNSIIKCGVTKTERLETRVMEQGADIWCELARFDNAKVAYATELRAQKDFHLINAVWNSTKLKILNESANEITLKQKVESILLDRHYSGVCIQEPKIIKNIYHVPTNLIVSNKIDGRVISSKSKLLFYEKQGQHFVVNMTSNEGRIFVF